MLHISNPRIHLQEDGCIEHTLRPTRLLKTDACKTYRTLIVSICNRLPEDELSGSKHVEDIKKLKTKILI